jgi:hypothetical protein
MINLKSKCCYARLKAVRSGDEIDKFGSTNFYVCLGCIKACDPEKFCDFCGISGSCPDCGPALVDYGAE